mmetsp:Transcript_6936/g.16700  ORF Transcript_6936/g.16700 Transcript_6936/m.16700 type:complete len:537 (+) Transcript_6936:66-1676(+)
MGLVVRVPAPPPRGLCCFLLVATTAMAVLCGMATAEVDTRPPTILDTDYGSFIDDIFAVGLLLQSTDVLDPRLVLTTAEEPEWSANCVSEQIVRSAPFSPSSSAGGGRHVPVAIGETLPPHSERGAVCGVPGLVGFALRETCASPSPRHPPVIPNGVEHVARMLGESDRTDWTYIAVGGQTSLQRLVRDFPGVLPKIRNLVIMGGNFCTGFDAYPDVPTPTAETNIGCDMKAANFVLESAAAIKGFPAVHYVPIVTVNVLDGDDYSLITDAASPSHPHHSPAANATIDFYHAWSRSARSDPGLLVHKEAMTFDPAKESVPQFDAVAVLVAMDIARGASDKRVAQYAFANGVHFVTNEEAAAAVANPGFFRGKPPKAAYSVWSGDEASLRDTAGGGAAADDDKKAISGRCDDLTPFHFDPDQAPPSLSSVGEDGDAPATEASKPAGITVALGFWSPETERDFFHEMALRISGRHAATTTEATTTATPSAPAQKVSDSISSAAEPDRTRAIEQPNLALLSSSSSSSSSSATTVTTLAS